MKNYKDIRQGFYLHFSNQMKSERFMDFFYELFLFGSAYAVGGYFRDFMFSQKSRDIDIITDISNDLLKSLVVNSQVIYDVNRYGGIKIKLNSLEIDIWTIENNWAFKNNLVKLNDNDKLNSIAKGCFYNFDALVINLYTYDFNLRYFNDCIEKKELNILQEQPIYKNLNPSVEANIIRAIHLSKNYNLDFSKSTIEYLIAKIGYIEDKYSNSLERLIEIKNQYSKYQFITESDILNLQFKLREKQNTNQLKLDL